MEEECDVGENKYDCFWYAIAVRAKFAMSWMLESKYVSAYACMCISNVGR